MQAPRPRQRINQPLATHMHLSHLLFPALSTNQRPTRCQHLAERRQFLSKQASEKPLLDLALDWHSSTLLRSSSSQKPHSAPRQVSAKHNGRTRQNSRLPPCCQPNTQLLARPARPPRQPPNHARPYVKPKLFMSPQAVSGALGSTFAL